MHPMIELFGQPISTYAVMIIIGFALGVAVALFRRKINGMRADDVIACLVLTAAGAMLGGKFFYMAQGFPQFLELARTTGYTFLQYFSEAGLVYYGGFIGGILFLLLAAKVVRVPAWSMLDTVLPSVPLAHALGRVGCLFAGCCYGLPNDTFGFYFNASPFAPHDVRLLPVQLIEAVCVFGLFLFMVCYGRKKRAPGRILSIYLIGYGIIRFILEFFRYDAYRGIYGEFSISQWISLILIALGLFFVFLYPRLSKKVLPDKAKS